MLLFPVRVSATSQTLHRLFDPDFGNVRILPGPQELNSSSKWSLDVWDFRLAPWL